jgi:hypothetical protein
MAIYVLPSSSRTFYAFPHCFIGKEICSLVHVYEEKNNNMIIAMTMRLIQGEVHQQEA